MFKGVISSQTPLFNHQVELWQGTMKNENATTKKETRHMSSGHIQITHHPEVTWWTASTAIDTLLG